MRYYAKNWLNLLGALFLGAIIGLTYTKIVQVPLYKSDATMIITGRTSAADNVSNNYAELFKSRLVLETVVRDTGYTGSYEQLLARTTASTDKSTDVLRVSIADPDPKTSQLLLKASVETFKDQASTIYANSENIKTVDTATLPGAPYNVKATMQIGLAMAATFFAAVIALFFVYDYKNSNPKRTKATEKKAAKKAKKQGTKNTQASSITPKDDAKKSTRSKRTKNVNTPAESTAGVLAETAPKKSKKRTKSTSKK